MPKCADEITKCADEKAISFYSRPSNESFGLCFFCWIAFRDSIGIFNTYFASVGLLAMW
jgi:hypothetical protein